MYEDDTPAAERRAQALSLDRDLLRGLLGQEELRDLLDRDAVERVELQLRTGVAEERGRAARSPADRDDLGQAFDEGLAGPDPRAPRDPGSVAHERLIAAEDAGRYRDALGAMPPGGLPDAFLEAGERPLRSLVLRFAKGRQAVHDRGSERSLRRVRGGRSACAPSSGMTCSCEASPGGRSGNGATRRCCTGCAVRRWPRYGARVSP